MSKIPRDINAKMLITRLEKLGYVVIKQTGSHIRLENNNLAKLHRITIPNHSPIRIGTLNNILLDIADKMVIEKRELIKDLFS
jgi:predicted RNA binding protein YcfA (HicA-like mRNA interferase family)